jgi:hypothetical protein
LREVPVELDGQVDVDVDVDDDDKSTLIEGVYTDDLQVEEPEEESIPEEQEQVSVNFGLGSPVHYTQRHLGLRSNTQRPSVDTRPRTLPTHTRGSLDTSAILVNEQETRNRFTSINGRLRTHRQDYTDEDSDGVLQPNYNIVNASPPPPVREEEEGEERMSDGEDQTMISDWEDQMMID